jgi:upstream activation factor subunit UAF30
MFSIEEAMPASKSKRGTTAPKARRLNPALAKAVTPDEQLSAIVGKDPLPRPQVIKKVWDYIKAEHLQDTEQKRMINADDTLRPVFDGKSRVDMFEMTKLVNKHLH